MQASLAKLNELLGEEQAVPMQRFRPNVVVAGTQPWEEDDWETYTISGPAHAPCKFSATMPCDRCKARASPRCTSGAAPDCCRPTDFPPLPSHVCAPRIRVCEPVTNVAPASFSVAHTALTPDLMHSAHCRTRP